MAVLDNPPLAELNELVRLLDESKQANAPLRTFQSWLVRLRAVVLSLAEGTGFSLSASQRAVITDALGNLATSNVTSAELNYLQGLLSNAQTQFNSKVSKLGDTIGDFAGGDYAQFESDGTLVFVGDATVWRDINFPIVSLGLLTSPPDLITLGTSGTVYVRAFDGGATTEQIGGSLEIDHDYKEGSDIQAHIHWAPVNTNAGNVKWNLEYFWLEVDGTAGAPTTISVTTAAPGVAWKMAKSVFPAIAGTGHLIGSQFVFRLYRNPSDAADTYGSDAATTTFGVHIEIDTCGSRQITTK